ncbi:hypothetical protein [Pararhizobium gei]|uniref:hypothetical protein n=1 Tax=Pararhizobium gei TaxID=1395951 RepID=UPI0023DA0A36|nr:hypothetical protein [Rhizobium gei]
MTYQTRRRLVMMGTGPAAVALCRMAAVASFEVELHSNDEFTLHHGEMAGAGFYLLHSPHQAPTIQWGDRSTAVFAFHDHDWERNCCHLRLQAMLSMSVRWGAAA